MPQIEIDPSALRVVVSGDVTLETVADLESALDELWPNTLSETRGAQTAAPAKVALSLEGLESADSSILALICEWQSRALEAGTSLVLSEVPDAVAALAAAYDLDLEQLVSPMS